MSEQEKVQTVSDIVRKDYRTADVFKKWGVNYCCGGNLPLDQVCLTLNLDQEKIETELKSATQNVQLPNALSFDEWPFDFLVDYIVHVHHGYVKIAGPKLNQLLTQFVEGHKTKYPYLVDVQYSFDRLLTDLTEHLAKEEQVIFPYIKQVNNSFIHQASYGALFVRTLQKSLTHVIEVEHQNIANLLTALRSATNNYTFNEKACTNHQVIYHKLKEFDADIMQHKHLENNILFPKAMQMEKELLQL